MAKDPNTFTLGFALSQAGSKSKKLKLDIIPLVKGLHIVHQAIARRQSIPAAQKHNPWDYRGRHHEVQRELKANINKILSRR